MREQAIIQRTADVDKRRHEAGAQDHRRIRPEDGHLWHWNSMDGNSQQSRNARASSGDLDNRLIITLLSFGKVVHHGLAPNYCTCTHTWTHSSVAWVDQQSDRASNEQPPAPFVFLYSIFSTTVCVLEWTASGVSSEKCYKAS